jgi:hypothetical protein
VCVEITLVSAILVQDASWTGVFIPQLQWIVDRVLLIACQSHTCMLRVFFELRPDEP